MMKTLSKAINTLKITKAVFNSKEFDRALGFASYKLNKIAKEEDKALNELKTAYRKEKRSITKLHTEQRKAALNAFFSDLKAIYRNKELQQTELDNEGHIVTVFD